MPVIVWVPEVLNPLAKPFCIVENCSCMPRLREYKSRVVEDVYHKSLLLYVKYECAATRGKTFSTVSADYLRRSARIQLQFPYIMTKKFGLSREFMDLVYEAMLANGMQSLTSSLWSIRYGYSCFRSKLDRGLLRRETNNLKKRLL